MLTMAVQVGYHGYLSTLNIQVRFMGLGLQGLAHRDLG